MRRVLYSWLYYTFRREQYRERMGNLLVQNLLSLRHVNVIIAVVIGGSSF
jgi:hypothetical protein